MKEQDCYRESNIELTKEAAKRCMERNFPISELRRMVFGGRWCQHIRENKRTCVYRDKDAGCYWTIIIAPTKGRIFIITVYKSNYSEKRMFKSFDKEWYLKIKEENKIDWESEKESGKGEQR
jgi:hypothetical protein